jgi:hypothetical protein
LAACGLALLTCEVAKPQAAIRCSPVPILAEEDSPMRTPFLFAALACLLALPLFAAQKEEPKKVELKGKLTTGIVAIGGETTGTVIATKDGKFELDFGKDKEMRAKAKQLNGKTVVVTGTLTVRKGVEVKERKIVIVTTLKPADEK